MIIIFGASGFIGSHLYSFLASSGTPVLGTCLKRPRAGMIRFDLSQPDLARAGINLHNISHAIICASSVTDLDAPLREEARYFRENVEGVQSLFGQLLDHHVFPVFLSSGHVFDGRKGHYSETDTPTPCSAFGRHKHQVEQFLIKTGAPHLILRFGKVFGLSDGDGTLFTAWAEQLRRGETIRGAVDQTFSPLWMDDLVKALNLAIGENLRGIYHISSGESFSRFDLAVLTRKELGISTGQVEPCSIRDFDFLDPRPLDTSLNGEKLQQATGHHCAPVQECLRILRNRQN